MVYNKQILESKKNHTRIAFPIIILVFVIVFGAIGYYVLWHFEGHDATLIDALYMTFITITTVGYQEVFPLETPGRIITILVAVIGVGSLFFLMSAIMEKLVSDEMTGARRNRRMQKTLNKLSDHVILVGMGRVGTMVMQQLLDSKRKFVVVSSHIESDFVAEDQNVLCIQGDATEEKTLELAGIAKASGIIIATADPAVTAFVIMSAKELNPSIYTVARNDNQKDISKLMKAGADRIVNPYKAGGQRLAVMMMNRNVVDVIEANLGENMPHMALETIDVALQSVIIGRTLAQIDFRRSTGATILAIQYCDSIVTNPLASYTFKYGDRVTVFGTKEDLKKVEKLLTE